MNNKMMTVNITHFIMMIRNQNKSINHLLFTIHKVTTQLKSKKQQK